jgi:hypothetical protein
MSTASRHRPSAPRRQIVAYLVVISRPDRGFMIVVDYLRYMTKTHHDHGMSLSAPIGPRGSRDGVFWPTRVARETSNLMESACLNLKRLLRWDRTVSATAKWDCMAPI